LINIIFIFAGQWKVRVICGVLILENYPWSVLPLRSKYWKRDRLLVISFSEEPHWRISQRVTCAILAQISGTESEVLSRRTYQFPFYKYRWLMRISEIFLLENCEFYLNIASYVSCILRHFVDYGIPLSQIKIMLFILANRECLNIVFIFAGQWKASYLHPVSTTSGHTG
jgi:hypothetical protein